MRKWQWWKNKSILILMVCEALLILALGITALIRQEKSYTWAAEEWQWDENGNAVTQAITLPRGIYRVQIDYACDSDMTHFSIVEKLPASQGSILCSGEHLNQGLQRTDYDLWVNTPKTELAVTVSYGGGQMVLGGLTIIRTNRDLYRAMFLILVGSIIVDMLVLARLYDKQHGISGETRKVMLGLGTIILLSSIPLGNDHLYGGSDITYHLLRVGNIKDGFLSGQFPVRIDPSWLFGNGYASSICYGELFLYFPAFLRMIGFTLQGSWMWFLFVLNVATCLVSYYSFGRIFKNRMIGLFCSALYTLSIYRLYKMYSWSAIGEVQAFVFLPLILYAVYGIYTEVAVGQTVSGVAKRRYRREKLQSENTAAGKRYWVVLAIGMSGLVQCHVLSCELVVGFLALTCLILIRKTLQRRVFLSFLKAIGAVCVLNAWFVVPFLDYMINMDMVIHHVSARTMQDKGLMIAQLLFSFFHRGVSRDLVTEGLINVEAMGVGIAMTFGLVVFLFLWVWNRKGGRDAGDGVTAGVAVADRTVASKQATVPADVTAQGMAGADVAAQIVAGKLSAVLGILAMVMSLSIFPWTQIQFLNRITQSLVSSIQYPNRFLMMATLFLTMTAGAAAVWLRRQGDMEAETRARKAGLTRMMTKDRLYRIAGVVIAVVTAVFYMDSIVLEASELKLYDEKGMGTGYLSGAEYLPYGTNAGLLTYHEPYPSEGVEISESSKEYLDVTFTCQNSGEQEGYVDVALLNYKSYVAKSGDGESLEVIDNENRCVRVVIPEGFTGSVHVTFEEPWYWQAAGVISLLSIVAWLAARASNRKKVKTN